MTLLPVALVQMRSTRDVTENLESAFAAIRAAAAAGARLVATPEMTTLIDRTPGAVWAQSTAEDADPALAAFRGLAQELSIDLLIGSMPFRSADVSARKCFNRAILIGPDGGVTARYDKIHRFDVQLSEGQTFRESDSYDAGDAAIVAPAAGALLGLTICYDMRFPHLYRDLARAGAQVLAAPSAFTKITGEAHWHVLLRARAIETGSFVIAPAQGGLHADGRTTYGHSLVVNPWGKVVAELAHDEPGVLHAELDLDEVAAARSKIPALQHDRPYRPPARSGTP